MFSNRLFQRTILIPLRRFYNNDLEKLEVKGGIQKIEKEKLQDLTNYKKDKIYGLSKTMYWNERAALRKEKRANRFPNSVNSLTDLKRHLQNLNNFPQSFEDLFYLLSKRKVRRQLIEQKYLPERVNILRPDLAAAHFITERGGSVKFVGSSEWVGLREKKKDLPMSYIPGMFVEGIKAEKTSLLCEGLLNLSELYHLSYLSLKNLDTVNDWFLDLLSQEHCENLQHLDISGCKNVTYRGLSCFYRFENLKVLEVEGVSNTHEFKLACLMLLDVMPLLDIRGIDLSLPEEIKPANVEDSDKASATVENNDKVKVEASAKV